MGEVYRGFDTSLGRPVAIKVIRPELARDPRFLQIFQREAQAQANVVHSHVLQAYFVGEEQGIWFLAMQIVEGGTLEDVLVRGAPLSWKDAARHMTAVVAGMAEAARLGIIHRDIKPANILLDRDGDAHLADFGLATSSGLLPTADGPSTGPNTRKPGSTHAGAVMGTLEYMPPEQLEGKPLDERADIYAIGASFYQLLSGRLPYVITDIPGAKAAHRGPPPTPLTKLRPEVPRGFARLIDRCLSRDANARPASHTELLGILAKVGPRPEVRPSAIVRALSLILDLVPFAVAFWPTYLRAPGLAFAVLVLWLTFGFVWLSATPGQWLMRLWLRGEGGVDVPLWKALARSLLQLGWLLPGSLFVWLVYSGSASIAVGLLAAVWAAVALFGSLLALGPSGRTLHDRLTDTQVLVATG
jgi:serine/threonine protein kinase